MNYGLSDILQYGLLYLNGITGITPIILWTAAACVIGYLLGSVNFGIIISKAKYGDDIRNHGSGNAGMTNMLRTYGKKAALFTVAGDMGKTILACLIGALVLGQTGAFLAGFASMLGHMWPVFFKFKGGKGVLSIAAVTLFCCPAMCLVLFTLFFIIVAATKYLSLGSVICVMLYPIVLSRFIGTQNFVIIPAFIMCMIIVWQHRTNIKRLYNKNENKIHLGRDGKFLPKWLLIAVSAVLVAASLLTVYFTFFKKTYAVEYKDFKITSAHMRILFIDEKNGYFKDGEKNEEHDEEIMQKAVERAKRMVVLGKCATENGYSISSKGSDTAKNYFNDNLTSLPGYLEGDTAETYCHRIYGSDVSVSSVLDIVVEEIFVGEYVSSAGEDTAEELISGAAESGELKIDTKTIKNIINRY